MVYQELTVYGNVVGCGMEHATLTPPSTLVLRRASCCCFDRQPVRNLPDGSGLCDRMGPTVRWNRLAVLGPVPRSSSTTGCCRNVGGSWLTCRRRGRPAGAGFGFLFSLLLAFSVSPASDFSLSVFVQSPSALLVIAAFGDFTHNIYVFILSTISNSF